MKCFGCCTDIVPGTEVCHPGLKAICQTCEDKLAAMEAERNEEVAACRGRVLAAGDLADTADLVVLRCAAVTEWSNAFCSRADPFLVATLRGEMDELNSKLVEYDAANSVFGR